MSAGRRAARGHAHRRRAVDRHARARARSPARARDAPDQRGPRLRRRLEQRPGRVPAPDRAGAGARLRRRRPTCSPSEPRAAPVNAVQRARRSAASRSSAARGETRGWITTSSCELAVPFDYATGAGWPLALLGREPQRRCRRATRSRAASRRYQSSGARRVDRVASRTNFTSAALRIGNRLVVATSNIQQAGSSPIWNPGHGAVLRARRLGRDDDGHAREPVLRDHLGSESDRAHRAARRPRRGDERGHLRRELPAARHGAGQHRRARRGDRARSSARFRSARAIPAGRGLALDPTGSVAVAGSATLRQLVAVDVRGVAALPARAGRRAPAAPVVQRHRRAPARAACRACASA